MKREIKLLLCFILLLFIGFGCTTDSKPYKYEAGFWQMIEAIGLKDSLSLHDGLTYLMIIPTSGCSPCMEIALETIKTHPQTVPLVIFSGNAEAKKYAMEVHAQQKVIIDTNNRIRNFETGIFSPSLITIEKNTLLKINDLTASSVNEFYSKMEEAIR